MRYCFIIFIFLIITYNKLFASTTEDYLVYDVPEWYDIKMEDYILTANAEKVSNNRYDGYIFPRNFIWYPYCFDDPWFKLDKLKYRYPYAVTKYQPSYEEVEKAESILRKNIKKYALKSYGYIPECLNNLDRYTRQYFGIFDMEYGKNMKSIPTRIIYVNLVNTDALDNYINPKTSKPYNIEQTYIPIQITDTPGASTIEVLINLTDKKITSLNL